jgi:hypothetical protein
VASHHQLATFHALAKSPSDVSSHLGILATECKQAVISKASLDPPPLKGIDAGADRMMPMSSHDGHGLEATTGRSNLLGAAIGALLGDIDFCWGRLLAHHHLLQATP